MAKFKPQVKSYDHQRKFVQWYWQKTTYDDVGSKGGGAFFDPGTGKTKTAYDFISAGFFHRGVRRVLVLCPINAIGVWDIQADSHIRQEIPFRVVLPSGSIADKTMQVINCNGGAKDDELTILVLNYAAIIKRDAKWAIMRALLAYAPDVLVLDESHHIKGATTKQSKAAHKLAEKAESVMILTGTPIGKNYLDLYSQLKAVDPKIWKASWTKTGIMSWTDFRNNYGVFGGKSGYELKGFRNLDDLKSRYLPHIRTARKTDIHDMPKVSDSIVPVELSATARRVYDVFAENGVVVHQRRLIEAPIPLTKLLRLQQMTGGWVNDEHGDTVQIQLDKLSVLTDLLAELAQAGKSVVVFARFIPEMDAIQRTAIPIFDWVGAIRGSVSDKQRISNVERFQKGGPNCMVIQSAAAESIDGLQETCSYGIFYSADYSLIHWNQARGRLDRVGQKEPVTFYRLEVVRSVDGLIFQALKDKKDIEKTVMDNPQVLLRHQ